MAGSARKIKKRPIFIDGSNVARKHGINSDDYNCRAIALSIKHFVEKRHKCKAVVPQYRFDQSRSGKSEKISDPEILLKLHELHLLILAPGNQTNPIDDDDFSINMAKEQGGIVVSNDQFRNHKKFNPEWASIVEKRLLHYTFNEDFFLPAPNPLGKDGPTLDEFLSCSWDSDDAKAVSQQQLAETDIKALSQKLDNIITASQNKKSKKCAIASDKSSTKIGAKQKATAKRKSSSQATKYTEGEATEAVSLSHKDDFSEAAAQMKWLNDLNELRNAANQRDFGLISL